MTPEEEKFEQSLRPQNFEEFIGQETVKNNLKIVIEAAKRRGGVLDHALFHGPPGLGKTSLANIIAATSKGDIRVTSGPAIARAGDLAAILTGLKEGDVLFIDEIHRLNRTIEELLYPAMEEYVLHIVIGKGPSAKTVRLELPKFTVIGATTRFALLSSPLRDRFGIVHRLDYYQDEDIRKILKRSAKLLSIVADEEGIFEISKRSRKTPRIANRLLKRVRDYAEVEGTGVINAKISTLALENLDIDELGLDLMDRGILTALINKYNGGPVGIETLAALIHEERDTLEDIYEPFLMQVGLLERTSRGRVATPAAYKHLGIKSANTLLDAD